MSARAQDRRDGAPSASAETLSAQSILELVLEALPSRVFWKDLDSRMLGFNQKFLDDACAEASDLLGKDDFDMHPADLAREYYADDLEVIQGGKSKLGIEEPHTLGNGETIWVETNKVPIRTPEGEVIGLLGCYQDVTARRQARLQRTELIEALTRARDEAVAASEAKSAFVSNMSHELRTPLNAIIGYSEILAEDAEARGDENSVGDAQRIRKAAGHLLSLINDVLDLSKIEAGRMEVNPQETDVLAIARDVIDALRATADRKGTALALLTPLTECVFQTDALRLKQCLFNLVSNAVKFTEAGAIDVEIRREGATIVIAVQDTGIGIAADQIENVFQPFTQADLTITRRFGGTGLGLSITRSLVNRLGGDITLTSAPGEGSRFEIRLPA